MFTSNISMTDYNKAIAEFEVLSSEDKKSELLSLLQKFERLDDVFVKLIGAVSTKNYTDRILNWIYKVLVMSLEKIDQMDLQSWLNELQNLFQVLERIHAAEKADRQQEWDPEKWLEQILSDKY